MKKTLLTLIFALALAFANTSPASAFATQTPPPAPEHAPPKTINETIGEQIQALVGPETNLDIEPQETFGTRAFTMVLTLWDVVRAQSDNFATNVAGLPQVGEWFNQQQTNPKNVEKWTSIFDNFILVIGLSGPMSILVHFLLTGLRHHLANRHYSSTAYRFWASLGRVAVALVPLMLFIGAALVLLNGNDPSKLTRYVIMNVIYAVALQRLIHIFISFLLAPKAPNLRMIAMSNESAIYIRAWIERFSILIIFGYFCVDVAYLMRVPTGAITTFNSFLGLCIVTLAIHIIVEKRTSVALFIRGAISPYSRDLSLWESLRLWLSKTWHNLALAYLLIGYAVTTMSQTGGFGTLLRGTILTLIALFCVRVSFHSIDRLGAHSTSHFYRFILRMVLRLFVWAFALVIIAASWGADIVLLASTPWGQRIAGSAMTIGLTFLGAALTYEWINASINKRLNKKDINGILLPATARAQTLLPLARNTALVVLSIVVVMVALSEFGVNIAPLLAGAGVIGVAIGFGSQSLVKDFITGLFILVEDAIAIGDIVSIGGLVGVVESMTIRTLRIRDVNGDLHILPFGDVTKITNSSKNFSYALMDIDVAYTTNISKAKEVLKAAGEELMKDPMIAALIMEPVDIFGLESLSVSSMVLRCRIKTRPGNQGTVRRAYLQKTKELFDKEGIEIPYQTIRYINAPNINEG